MIILRLTVVEDRESGKSAALIVQNRSGSHGGDQGAQGNAGMLVEPGAQGVRGAQGDAGVQGVPGAQGLMGPQGVAGAQGPAGPGGEVAIRAVKYFYAPDSDVAVADTFLIPADEFTDDDGGAVSEFDLAGVGASGYTNLYVNGMVQRTSTYRLDPHYLAIDAPGETIYAGTPIIVEIVQITVVPLS